MKRSFLQSALWKVPKQNSGSSGKKKKWYLKALMIFLCATIGTMPVMGQAPSLPINFDDAGINYDLAPFGNGGISAAIVADPVDASNNALSITKPAGSDCWAGVTVGNDPACLASPIPFTATDMTIAVDVYSPVAGAPILVKVENCANPALASEILAFSTVANAWETLTFDLSMGCPAPLDLAITYDQISVFPNFVCDPDACGASNPGAGIALTSDPFFIDNIELLTAPAVVELPLNFDDTSLSYSLLPFSGDGQTSAVIGADPTDPNNPVVCVTKPPGTDCWAGATIGTGPDACLDVPVAFAPGTTTVTADVYSPVAGAPILLKLEDCANAALSTEILAFSTAANTWETLTFDLSMGCPNPVDFAITYDKLSVFPNFTCDPDACGNANPGIGSPFSTDAFYFDNIQLISAPVVSACSGNVPIENLANGMDYTIVSGPDGTVEVELTVVDNPAGLVGFFGGPGNPISFPDANGTFTFTFTGQTIGAPFVLDMFFNWAGGGQGNSDTVTITVGDCGPPVVVCTGNVPIENLANGLDYTITSDATGNVDVVLTVVDNPAGLVGFFGGPGNPISFPDATGTFTFNFPSETVGSVFVVDMFFNWAAGGQGNSETISVVVNGPCTPPDTDVEFCVDLSCLPAVVGPSVFGTFPGAFFDPNQNLLTDPDGDGIYCATVTLPPGDYEFLFFNDGAGEAFAPGSPCTVTNFGFTNRSLTVGTTSPQMVLFGWESCDATCTIPPPAPEIPIDFEDTMVDYNLSDFGGAGSFIGPDPTDASNQVLCINKPPGSECWAGTTIGGDPTCLENPITFSAGNMVLTMDVFSGAAGTPMLLKVENCTNPAISSEVLVLTTVANTWETLVFDFSTGCPAPLDLNQTYDQISVFPNFTCDPDACGVTNPGAASPFLTTPYYVDNIQFCDESVPPVITCPADVTLACGDPTTPATTGMATATNLCSVPVISFVDVSTQGMGCSNNSFVITRTWTATDDGGNIATCVQMITVEDLIPPTIVCPADATIQCDESIIPAASGSGTATATSATNVLTWSDATSGFIGTVPVTPAGIPTGATVTDVNITLIGDHSWVGDLNLTLESPDGVMVNFLDNTTCPASGNTDNYNVTFDDQAGAFNCTGVFSDTGTPDDCSNDYLNGAGVSGTMQPEQNNFAVFNGGTAAGAWILSVTDDAGGDGGCLISFSVDVSWELSGAGGTTGVATAVDNCAADTELVISFADVTDQTATGCGQYQYSITRTWTATDPCGNASTCVQMITVEDTTPPVITCPADVSGSCTDSTVPADTGMATATDNCSSGGEVVIAFVDATSQSADGCGLFTFAIERTWTATDACGNIATCLQTISIADDEAPMVTCPANQTLACDTDPLPIATTIDEFLAIGGTATDNCTNVSDLTLAVSDSPSAQSMLDFCPSSSVADRTLTRTYTITDACGNVSTCEQLFIYDPSTTGPAITATPADQTVDCAVNAFPQLGLFDAIGTCSGITTSVSGPSSNGTAGCPGNTIQYTYTATDVCGRSVSHVQTYTLANEGPQFVCPPDICVIDCPSDNDMIQQTFDDYAELATVISSCSETGITIGNNFNPNNFIQQNCMNPTIAVSGAVAFQVVTFTATDVCGRNSNCTALVVIRDTEGPVMTGSVSTGVANCDDTNIQQGYSDWANIQANNLEAMDECSGTATMVTYSPATPNTDCSSGLATTVVSFTATDACGNETTQTANYRIIDNGSGEPVMATVTGTLMTEESELVALADVEVDGFLNSTMTTGDDGYYHFDLMMAQNYGITPSRNDDPLNGITTYDLILLGQHILEVNILDSPYKLIAADVNESGHISALDMIELRRLILHIDDEFSSGKSWTFVDAEYVFPNPLNPFASTYPTSANINNLTSSQVIDFIGVKLGDLNASAVPNLLQSGDTRSSDGQLKIKLEDEMLSAGQTYQLAFNASDFKEVAGFQFTLDFAADYLEVLDYETSELSNMSANNFGFTKANEGKITVSWNETNAVSMADDATLFQVSFTALKDVQLSEVLAITSSVTANEAYQADLRKDVVLDFGNAIAADKGFTLLQNQPNPFSQETVIGFQLPEATEATLTIYDVSGRVVYTRTNTYDAGLHQVMMNKSDLGATGVLYYQLSTSEFNETKKMIVLK